MFSVVVPSRRDHEAQDQYAARTQIRSLLQGRSESDDDYQDILLRVAVKAISANLLEGFIHLRKLISITQERSGTHPRDPACPECDPTELAQ